MKSQPTPLEAATRQLLGRNLQELVDEIMDFLGGVFIRQEGLDGGACEAADGLLSLYSANSGIPWLARAVPGENPLFSQAVDLVHLHFPDWEVWNLPLLAHEFGHITVSNTPGFRELFASELSTLSDGHPQAAAWTAEQRQAYLAARAAHLHEFFADAYAVFTQGPAFVFAALYLNFNPAQAYASRTGHPSHAERAALIFSVLEAMDEQAKASEYDTGPYAGWLKRASETWNAAVQANGGQPAPEDTFNLAKARSAGQEFLWRAGLLLSPGSAIQRRGLGAGGEARIDGAGRFRWSGKRGPAQPAGGRLGGAPAPAGAQGRYWQDRT